METQTATNRICPVCHSDQPVVRVAIRGDGKPVCRCQRCGCGLLDVELNDDIVASFYQESYFTAEHPAYFADLRNQPFDPAHLSNLLLDRIAAFVDLQGARFLDIGCAAGVLLAAARHRGAEVVGIEISEAAAEKGRATFGLEILTGRPRDHQLPDESFDVICMIDVIEHLLTPRDDISAIARLLKPGGVLCVLTPNFEAFKVFGRRWHGLHASYEHILYFNSASLALLLRTYGLAPVHTETLGMVNLLEYYVPRLANVLPGGLRAFGDRLFSKLLRALRAEHRLLMLAQKQ